MKLEAENHRKMGTIVYNKEPLALVNSMESYFKERPPDCSLFSHFQPRLKFIDLDCTGMLSLCCSLYCGAALLRKCETTKYTRHLSRI